MRALRFVVATVLVLGVLFAGADRLAVYLAENEAADRIRSAEGMPEMEDADVSIKGFPFLTQAASGDIGRVDAELSGIRAKAAGQELTVDRIDAQLHDVRIGEKYDSATAARASGSALVTYKDLTRAAGNHVTVGWGGRDGKGRGRVKVTASVSLFGQTFERSVHSTVALSGNKLELHADDVPGAGIPGVEDAVRERIDLSRSITGLPKGIELDRVDATKQGIKLSVKGSDVRLG